MNVISFGMVLMNQGREETLVTALQKWIDLELIVFPFQPITYFAHGLILLLEYL
jgi:hypothetical protein